MKPISIALKTGQINFMAFTGLSTNPCCRNNFTKKHTNTALKYAPGTDPKNKLTISYPFKFLANVRSIAYGAQAVPEPTYFQILIMHSELEPDLRRFPASSRHSPHSTQNFRSPRPFSATLLVYKVGEVVVHDQELFQKQKQSA